MADAKQPDDQKATLHAEVLSDAILDAAVKLAATKVTADSSKEKRDFWKAVILASLVATPGIISAWRIGTVHDVVNSRMTEMIKVVGKSSHAEGVLEGEAASKAAADKAAKGK